MLVGHFGLAAIIKSRQPQLPLWALMLCVELLDVVFLVLYFVGTETFKSAPGTSGGYGEKIYSADYSYSLVGALVASLVVLVVAWVFWGRRNALILGAVTFGAWILDFIVHRGDMAVLPGDASGSHIGLGLWTIPIVALIVELVIGLLGTYLYYHASMRMAVRLERQQGKAGSPTAAASPIASASAGYRQSALISTVVLLVLVLGTIAAEYLVA